MKLKSNTLVIIGLLILIFSACRKRDAPLPDNTAQFESTQQGIAEGETSKTISIRLARAVSGNASVILSLTPSEGLVYGTHFTTTPAAVAGTLTLPVPSGNSEFSFTVNKISGALFYGDETIDFKIESSAEPIVIGTGNQFRLSFSEIISSGSTIVGNGGGASYPNKLFFDLSANSQLGIQRGNWDLGFYTGTDFNVILNSSTGMMAKRLEKTDLNAVSAIDTLGFSSTVIFNQSAPTTESLAFIDYPSGDLSKTAIAPISATVDENKVYIINRGSSANGARGWKKIRVIRNAGGGYSLQHADIDATNFTTVDIAKDAAYFFNYVSFETGAVPVEPKKNKWDLAWTYFSNTTNFGTGEVPYLFQDIILQNRNVEIAKIMTTTKAYADFTEADLVNLGWLSSQNAIGADWRAGGGPTSLPSVRIDRYYIIKDGDGNYFKLKFTAMTQAGERGFPAFEYVLLKKG